jgi:hypothetical protein
MVQSAEMVSQLNPYFNKYLRKRSASLGVLRCSREILNNARPASLKLRCCWHTAMHAVVPRGVADRELAVLQVGLGLQAEQLRNRGLCAIEGPGNVLQAVLQFAHVAEVVAAYGAKGGTA